MRLNSLRGTSEKYGISLPMLKKLVFNKEITVVKIGAKNFIKEEDIEAYIDERTVVKECKDV